MLLSTPPPYDIIYFPIKKSSNRSRIKPTDPDNVLPSSNNESIVTREHVSWRESECDEFRTNARPPARSSPYRSSSKLKTGVARGSRARPCSPVRLLCGAAARRTLEAIRREVAAPAWCGAASLAVEVASPRSLRTGFLAMAHDITGPQGSGDRPCTSERLLVPCRASPLFPCVVEF